MKNLIKRGLYHFVQTVKLDDFLASNHSEHTIFQRLIPPPTFYSPSKTKHISRDGVSFIIHPNDLMHWLLYTSASEKYGVEEFFKLHDPTQQELVILDIGANCGQFSLNLAQRLVREDKTFQCFAFEPNPYVFQYLSDNIDQNPHLGPMIQLCPFGLGEKEDTLTIQMPIRNSGAGSILRDYQHEPHEKGEIKITVLDKFVQEANINRIDFIKLDVECYEPFVLKGGYNSINTFGPDLFVEISNHCHQKNHLSPHFIHHFLWDLGYQIFARLSQKVHRLTPAKLESLTGMIPLYNILATRKNITLDSLN